MVFSVQVPNLLSSAELIKRIRAASLTPIQTKIFLAVYDAGVKFGECVRSRQDDDAPTIGSIYRTEYEQGIEHILEPLPEAVRTLALDLATLAYQEAHRLQSTTPSSLRELREVLAA